MSQRKRNILAILIVASAIAGGVWIKHIQEQQQEARIRAIVLEILKGDR